MKLFLIPALSLATLVSAQNDLPVAPVPVPPPTPADPANPTLPSPPLVRTVKSPKRSEARATGQQDVMVQAVSEKIAALNERRERIELDLPRTTKTGRTLVVQSSNPEPSDMANLEEDLSVMSLILRKATGGTHGDEKRLALGIEVDSSVFGSSSGARNMYLEGYGAMFLLAVPFPLIAPPDKVPPAKSKEKPGSDWAEAREELLNADRSRFEVQLERAWSGSGKAAQTEFDAARVETLTTEILRALKNATHIRALKPESFVTIVIQGAESVRTEKWTSRASGERGSSGRAESKRGETVMTVRVKKADIESFASGTIDVAAFRKKAAIQTYFRRGDSSVATATFLGPADR